MQSKSFLPEADPSLPQDYRLWAEIINFYLYI